MGPGQRLIGERAQHLPRGVAAADRHDEATPRRDGGTRLPGGEYRARSPHLVRVGERLDPHDELTIGFSHPHEGDTRASTSFGPHVPGSYSWTGVAAFSTGSTMRHASST